MAEKPKPNLKVLLGILVNGEHVAEGTVLPKSAFAKGDWENLAFSFAVPRLEETDEPVGVPAVEAPVMPGTKATR